jgi:TonB family protein
MRTHAVIPAALLCAVSFAQPTVYHVGRDVVAPVLISREEPQYSEEARIAKLQGTVLLSTVVGEDGKARDIRVVRSLGLGLDESAIAAVAKWNFTPASKGGQPVAVQTQVTCNFRLQKGPDEWSLARAQFNVPPGSTLPSILRAPYPQPTGQPENAAVRLTFDVDAQGMPVNLQVENSSDPKWNDEVIAMIREWRFKAALNNGTAFQSHGVLDFIRGPEPPARVGMPPQKKR